ncbi:hypothetical protein N7490_002134, partial [Penicillium lividum]
VNLPKLQFTPLDNITERVSITRQAFLDHKTRDVEFHHGEQIVKAYTQDLNKPIFKTEMAEIGYLLNDIVKDEKAPDIDFVFKFFSPKIRKDLLSYILVISANIGRIVSKAAATHLTPIILELGGINPAIISRNANLRLNYILVEKLLLSSVIDEFEKAYKEFYPNRAKYLTDFSRIVSKDHFRRLRSILENTHSKIVIGGTMDKDKLFIEPIESFGLFILILLVNSLDEAIELANGLISTPLNLHPFGNKVEVKYSKFPSFNINIRRALYIPTLPFGSVGESGYGAYRGRKLSGYKAIGLLKPDFDRSRCKLRFGWIRFILT